VLNAKQKVICEGVREKSLERYKGANKRLLTAHMRHVSLGKIRELESVRRDSAKSVIQVSQVPLIISSGGEELDLNLDRVFR
jgi:hypothetical protein